jgi:hypothetical protein
MLRLTGDHNDDDYYEDDVGVDKTSCFPSAYTSFCLVSGTLRACPLCLEARVGQGPAASNSNKGKVTKEERMDRIPVTAGLTYVSAAVSFLELRVGILSGAWMSVVSVGCWQVEVSATS